jgi:DNA-directed RNA polymerase subunit beta
MSDKLENIYRERVDFSKLKTAFPMPDLLAIQKQSYAEFLQMELLPEERQDNGLQAAFKDSFPVSDFKETTQLDFISYSIGDWECKCGRLKIQEVGAMGAELFSRRMQSSPKRRFVPTAVP